MIGRRGGGPVISEVSIYILFYLPICIIAGLLRVPVESFFFFGYVCTYILTIHRDINQDFALRRGGSTRTKQTTFGGSKNLARPPKLQPPTPLPFHDEASSKPREGKSSLRRIFYEYKETKLANF